VKTLTARQMKALAEGLTEALNPREEDGEPTWDCEHDRSMTVRLLGDLGLTFEHIEAVLKELDDLGGHCDCEVMLNILCRQESQAWPP